MSKLNFISVLLGPLVLTSVHAEGVLSDYSGDVERMSRLPQKAKNEPVLRCFTHPHDELFIGLEQRFKIKAPMAAVARVIQNFCGYGELFPDLKKVEITSQSKNRWDVSFEQRVPIPLVPNIRYEMIYEKSGDLPTRLSYRYQLKKSGTIKTSDGMIVLTQSGANETDYTEYDFFSASWGLAKLAGKERIWQDSVRGLYLSDLAIIEKSEQPTLSEAEALKTAEKKISEPLLKTCVQDRQFWNSNILEKDEKI